MPEDDDDKVGFNPKTDDLDLEEFDTDIDYNEAEWN